MEVSIEPVNADALAALILKYGRTVPQGVGRGMREIAKAVAKRAQDYAPRSPTRTIAAATLKVQRRSRSQRTPGGLEKSIVQEVVFRRGSPEASIFVASTAPAGKYAKYIHDLKGIKWWKRGPGTIAKGAKADEKFIERAIVDLQKLFAPIMENEIRKELAK